MLYSDFFFSALALTPSIVATVVFIVFAIRHAIIKKDAEKSKDGTGTVAISAKRMRVAGMTALTLWILLGAFNGLLFIAVRNM